MAWPTWGGCIDLTKLGVQEIYGSNVSFQSYIGDQSDHRGIYEASLKNFCGEKIRQ